VSKALRQLGLRLPVKPGTNLLRMAGVSEMLLAQGWPWLLAAPEPAFQQGIHWAESARDFPATIVY